MGTFVSCLLLLLLCVGPATIHSVYLGTADGSVCSKRANPAVPPALMTEISQWAEAGVSMDDVVERLRTRTVPPGYPLFPWMAG